MANRIIASLPANALEVVNSKFSMVADKRRERFAE